MKEGSSALIAFLNSTTEFLMADIYTLTLKNGAEYRYTDSDIQLKIMGNTFDPFMISRSRIRVTVGLEVDTLEVKVCPRPTEILDGMQWMNAVRNGALDGAYLMLERVFMPSWGDTSLGTLTLFRGRVTPSHISRTEINLSVKSDLELLDTQLPRNFYQSGCLNTLFDPACSLVKSSHVYSGSVTAVTPTNLTTNLSQSDGFFSLGTMVFTSGQNMSATRSIRGFAGGVIALALPLHHAVAIGDTFIIYPGCDKSKATCQAKFNNVVNFRGFPFVPDPETAT